MPVTVLVLLISWEEFRLPVLSAFTKKILLLAGMVIFLWIAVALVSLYLTFRLRKSHRGIRSKGWAMEKCTLCQRSLNAAEPPDVIEEHIVCAQCYERIEQEKQQVSSKSSP